MKIKFDGTRNSLITLNHFIKQVSTETNSSIIIQSKLGSNLDVDSYSARLIITKVGDLNCDSHINIDPNDLLVFSDNTLIKVTENENI